MSEWNCKKLLVVDQEPLTRDHLKKFLFSLGFETDLAADSQVLLEKMQDNEYGVLLLEDDLVAESNCNLLSTLRQIQPTVSVVIMASVVSVEAVIQAMREDVCDYILKPFDFTELTYVVKRAFDRHKFLVGLSSGALQQMDTINKVVESKIDL